jgi:hypothetical protein
MIVNEIKGYRICGGWYCSLYVNVTFTRCVLCTDMDLD